MARRKQKVQQRSRTLGDDEYRERCYTCYRPVDQCFCDAIPQIKNCTEVLILQHRRERTHPFNTARLVRHSLERCQLFVERNERFAELDLPIAETAGLLYPGPDSKLLAEIEPAHRPQQLIVLDGTWAHARTLFRDIPQLKQLPRYKLAPTTPGQYRIRLEPTPTSLSTLEATVAALKQLEPENDELDQLLVAFNTMVEQQLAHPNANYGSGAAPIKKANLNIPQSLRGDLENIVVAYGESTPVSYHPSEGWGSLNAKKKAAATMPPVYWVAQRLGSGGETFSCAIESQNADLSPRILQHMELSQSDFADSISLDSFRNRWRDFLRADDHLIVHNRRTIQLLKHAGAIVLPHETLKSVNHDPQREFDSITAFLESKSFPIEAVQHRGRAGIRLARIAALVRYLNHL